MENEWENIQPPYTATIDEDDDVVVVQRDTHFNDSSIFPPSNHEGLPVTPPRNHHQEPPSTPSSPSSPSSSSLSSPSLLAEAESEGPPDVGKRLRSRLGIISSEIIRFVYGIGRRVGFWSFVSALAVVVVGIYGRRLQRWRRRVEEDSKEHLMFLIRQKDQKINQLLLQIARMNEILSARRRVPILRVVVDGSHMIGPQQT